MRNNSPSHLWLFLCCSLLCIPTVSAGIVIDGVLDEEEWAGAEIYTDFVTVEPLTGTRQNMVPRYEWSPIPTEFLLVLAIINRRQ